MSKKSLQPCCDIASLPSEGRQGTKNSNISHRDDVAEIVLIYGGYLAKVLQYISKGGREMAICVAIYKNEGAKGKAKAGAKVCMKVPSIGSVAQVFQHVYLNRLTGYAEIVP